MVKTTLGTRISLGYEKEILRLSKRRVKMIYQNDLVNSEFDFSIGMETNLDTNKLKPICQKKFKPTAV